MCQLGILLGTWQKTQLTVAFKSSNSFFSLCNESGHKPWLRSSAAHHVPRDIEVSILATLHPSIFTLLLSWLLFFHALPPTIQRQNGLGKKLWRDAVFSLETTFISIATPYVSLANARSRATLQPTRGQARWVCHDWFWLIMIHIWELEKELNHGSLPSTQINWTLFIGKEEWAGWGTIIG